MAPRPAMLLAVLAALPCGTLVAQNDHDMAMPADSGPPPLYHNLGTLHRAIRTTSPEAQRYFDQGLRLTYAFNHGEAVRSFSYATTLDPDCAMCWWGIATALGPNINMPMDTAANAAAYDAIERAAQSGNRQESAANRALIAATAARYAAAPSADRSGLDSAYARQLRAATRRFPDDPDIGALFGEAMLDLRPWNQWLPDGRPQPGTIDAVAALERVIAKHPDHAGACHFYIHAIEASPTPEKALPCARRLPTLMPGAGHLVHMPAHIAIRLGDYAAAIKHNEHAVHADQMYLDGPHTNGFYGLAYPIHNWHFLSVAAAMIGRDSLAIDAARHAAEGIPPELAKQVPPLEFWLPMEYFALVRFQRWEEMRNLPSPPNDLPYTRAMWLFAHGMADSHLDHTEDAVNESEALTAIRKGFAPDAMVGLQSTDRMLGIASEILQGTIASQEGHGEDAVAHLKAAAALEDGLSYDEPPPWYIPARELLGGELLAGGKKQEAAAVFRADLRVHRRNAWATAGLRRAGK